MKKTILFTAVISLLLGCNANDNSEAKHDQLPPDAMPIELNLVEKTKSDNVFAFDIFKTTCRSSMEENIFISPLSISMALNMTLNGAKGETAQEMLTALRAEGYTMEQINEYSRSLSSALTSVDPSTELSIANSIWYRNDLQVKTSFLDANRLNYNAEVNSIDFTSPNALTQINSWCATHTKNRIKEIIKSIPDDAAMYLINAIYFKGIWLSKFDKQYTEKEDFLRENGTMQKVDMMRQTQDFNHITDENAAYLELPYGNKAFSMILALPHEGKTTQNVIDNLNDSSWSEIMKHLRAAKVNLRLPRFKMEGEYDPMNNILIQMGMTLPFSDFADFSDITGSMELKISKIIHKTFVELNEEGTEAAAVTAVEMTELSSAGHEPQTIDYFVNKPFVFAICEKSTGVILFMGKIGGFN